MGMQNRWGKSKISEPSKVNKAEDDPALFYDVRPAWAQSNG